ncbi:MAG: hypothetical protein MZV70_50490 [Desulfobacterales bacterium]|nr:hypothetical protein [Desulfobacterales bacterium]
MNIAHRCRDPFGTILAVGHHRHARLAGDHQHRHDHGAACPWSGCRCRSSATAGLRP